jgi:lysophospholipase L1-like esterase
MRWLPIAAFLLLALLACGEPRRDPVRVVLLGDSITEGAARPAVSYSELLVTQLGDSWEIVNIGAGGTSSRDWTPRSPPMKREGIVVVLPRPFRTRAIPALPADVVTVLLGSNDAAAFYEPRPVSPEEYRAALEEIIASLLQHGAGSVMLLTPPPRCGPVVNARLAEYREAVIELCRAGAAVVCGPDLFELMDLSHFDDCDVHPNAGGHALIARELAAALREHAQRP